MSNLHSLLLEMKARNASDLHITAGSLPQLRIDGELVPSAPPAAPPGGPEEPEGHSGPLTPADTQQICYAVLTEMQKQVFETESVLDMSFGVRNLGRYRGRIYLQRGAVSAVFRAIPFEIPPLEGLGDLPQAATLAGLTRGLVLFAGGSGSGKSTTMAALVDQVNRTRKGHIQTFESPIEFLHLGKSCLVSQVEVGPASDVPTYAKAFAGATANDAELVVIGGLADSVAIDGALSFVEAGRLVFATVPAATAVQAIVRCASTTAAPGQSSFAVRLGSALAAVVSQLLVSRTTGGRLAAFELVLPDPALRACLREGRIGEIEPLLDGGGGGLVRPLEQSLEVLISGGIISAASAAAASAARRS